MPAVSDDMILDVVNQADIPVGQIRRADVFAQHANFRVSHILIFNSQGELLLQRLAFGRKRNPGAWGSSVASYLFASESYWEAANRRVREELGIPTPVLTFIGRTQMMDDGCSKFISIFVARHDGPFIFDPSHIEEVEFVTPAHIERMIADHTRTFTPTFIQVFRYYESISLLRG